MSTLQAQIRALLREKENEDGLTPNQIGKTLRRKPGHVYSVLEAMEKIDAYVDRWLPEICPGGYTPVWCVVVPPERAPRPDPREPRKWPERKHGTTP